MSLQTKTISAAVVALTTMLYALPASAVPVLCEDVTRNHMYVDSAYVSSCVDAGSGNVNGNTNTDDFLLANPSLDYTGIGEAAWNQTLKTKALTLGTFSLDPDLWDDWSSIALGFKFGTGNQPDEWFVYLLQPEVSSGSWSFVNFFKKGGGLSHIQLYGVEENHTVPEPGTLGLFGVALIGAALARRRKQQNA
jgi:hypothetical protein